jgi:hypothetical protein
MLFDKVVQVGDPVHKMIVAVWGSMKRIAMAR